MERDYLSNLPKFLHHDILSRLSQKEAARTSVLSKAWYETWSTFPIISFSETQFEGMKIKKLIGYQDIFWKRQIFCDIVGKTLLRFYNRGLAIKQFKLCLNMFQDMAKDINIWLKMVCESGVEVLELHQPNNNGYIRREQCYILLSTIFETKSLVKLVLKGRHGVDLTFINHLEKNYSLKVISLEGICFENEQQIEHTISRCSSIEDITLDECFVYSTSETHRDYIRFSRIKSLRLHGLPKLKSVDVRGIQEINVDAPCLENLCYTSPYQYGPCKIYFDKCKNLRKLNLVYSKITIITENWFDELFEKFLILESLELSNCTMPKRINISSDMLKVLVLSPCSNLEEINIVAPNLLSCLPLGESRSDHVVKPSISFLECTRQLVVNIEIDIDYYNLCNFKEFIKEFVHDNVLPAKSISLYTHWLIKDEMDPIILKVSSTPPPKINQLILRNVPDNEALYLLFVNRLLSSCRPATISLCFDSLGCNKAFIEVFYETLMGRNKENCFCSSGNTKCWWHSLKGVKISSSTKTGENAEFKTILDAFQSSEDMNTISFNLEF